MYTFSIYKMKLQLQHYFNVRRLHFNSFSVRFRMLIFFWQFFVCSYFVDVACYHFTRIHNAFTVIAILWHILDIIFQTLIKFHPNHISAHVGALLKSLSTCHHNGTLSTCSHLLLLTIFWHFYTANSIRKNLRSHILITQTMITKYYYICVCVRVYFIYRRQEIYRSINVLSHINFIPCYRLYWQCAIIIGIIIRCYQSTMLYVPKSSFTFVSHKMFN